MTMTRGVRLLGGLAVLAAACGEGATTPGPVPVPAIDVAKLRCEVPPACGDAAAATVERYPSADDLEARLVGAWWTCDAPSIFGRGLELTPDREVYLLTEAPDGSGSCQRTTDQPIGAWWVFDISEQNPAGTFQLDIDWGGRVSLMVPTFTADVRRLDDAFNRWSFARLERLRGTP